MLERLKEIGSGLLGVLFFIGSIVAIALLFKGSIWISEKVLPVLFLIASIGVIITFAVFLPLSLIIYTRKLGATALFFMSYLFGVTLWFWGFLLSYAIWGVVGLVIGLIIAGVGVVPIAIVACAVNGMWSTVLQLLILIALTYGLRILSLYIFGKVEEQEKQARTYIVEVE